MNEESLRFTLELEQQRDDEFRIKFDRPQVADLLLDEPAPLWRAVSGNGQLAGLAELR
jgi:hypothetical protein